MPEQNSAKTVFSAESAFNSILNETVEGETIKGLNQGQLQAIQKYAIAFDAKAREDFNEANGRLKHASAVMDRVAPVLSTMAAPQLEKLGKEETELKQKLAEIESKKNELGVGRIPNPVGQQAVKRGRQSGTNGGPKMIDRIMDYLKTHPQADNATITKDLQIQTSGYVTNTIGLARRNLGGNGK